MAAPGIQQRRAEMAVTCGPGGCVHDYVPLYFGSRSLMLLSVINAKNVDQMDILYFESQSLCWKRPMPFLPMRQPTRRARPTFLMIRPTWLN
ncbi:DarT ssDNA thymidine ADP-ribosyltransferase family protein [Mesorhizobium sp.]|uniref:DarT ssDNA thymidine ADP-ribosyltransferase family protein n=1 Tax=Mesorhizobium sp. TaxID=1871066 RepID=UPI00341DCA1B